MNKIELLAPAGDMESLRVAVCNGANAVYLGVKQFNARNNIDGFNLDNLSQAVDFAHLFGVKVYLALNILFKDSELQSALDVVCEANNIGVDAFIVQDLGLVNLIKTNYPSIELHASTQMAIHNLEGVKILEKLGFTRVVLARETTAQEVKRIHENSNIEIEFFVQGALCVSFSGNCYMCSHLVNKSGNRGVCQQFCRLPYKFENNNVIKSGFLLSAKDICMLEHLDELQKIGVKSLKIEGRARRPFYVAQACKVYRKALDGNHVSKQELEQLNIAFNRGYTPAYFNGNGNIISQIQGNNGLEIGVVKQVKNGPKFNEVFIATTYNLQSKCGLKFIYNGEEIASIGAYDVKKVGDLYRVTTTSKIKTGSKVNIIQDESLEQQVLKNIKKIKVDMKFVACENQPLKLSATYNGIEVCVEGDLCQKAKTISTTKEQVLNKLSQSEVFAINNLDCELNNCYILNSSINKLRNSIYQNLTTKILKQYEKLILQKVIINPLANDQKSNNIFKFLIIDNIANLKPCDNIILDYDKFIEKDFYVLNDYCNQHKLNGYIDIPNFATENDINIIKKVLANTNLGVVANNIYALDFDCKMIGGQFLNVYNSYTIKALNTRHSMEAMFIEEWSSGDDFITDIPILQREKAYMTLLHCPFKQNCESNCVNCAYTDKSTFTINSGKVFKIKRKKTATCTFLLKD